LKCRKRFETNALQAQLPAGCAGIKYNAHNGKQQDHITKVTGIITQNP
jgi:hypothetical protein